MDKIAFLPFSIGSGFVAGKISQLLFGRIWSMVDDREPPKAEHRRVSFGKLALALVIEGALIALIRGAVDHGARRAYEQLTGEWPGEEAPEPK